MVNQLLLTPPIAFAVFIFIGLAIDRLGGWIATERSGDGAFRTSYACGEDLVSSRTQPKYNLYHVGIGFTVIHLVVLLFATMPVGESLGTAGLGVTVLAVLTLSLFALLKTGLKP